MLQKYTFQSKRPNNSLKINCYHEKKCSSGHKDDKALCAYKDVKVECAAKDGVLNIRVEEVVDGDKDCPLSHLRQQTKNGQVS